MITTTRLSSVRPTIPEDKVRWLGHAGGLDYAEHRGIEYMVTPLPVDPEAYSRQSGEVMISKHVRELVDGTVWEHDNLHRALVVPVGTFERLNAQQRARAAAQVRPPRPLDALSVHPLLRRQSAELLRTAPEADPLVAPFSERTRGIIMPGRELQRGPEAIIAVLRSKGVELTLSADKAAIVPMALKGVVDSVRELIERAAPLLLAHLRGEPLRCQLGHKGTPPEALSLLVGGAAACEQHLAGEAPQ